MPPLPPPYGPTRLNTSTATASKRKRESEPVYAGRAPRPDPHTSSWPGNRNDLNAWRRNANRQEDIRRAMPQSQPAMRPPALPSIPPPSEMDEDDIQMTGWRFAPSKRPSRLPPPSTRAKTPDRTIIIISDDDETEVTPGPSILRPAATSAKRKRSHATPESTPNTIRIDLTVGDRTVQAHAVESPRKRAKTAQQAKNDTREDPIMVSDSDEEPYLSSSSDSDYDNIYEGYDIGWTTSAPGPDEDLPDDDLDLVGAAVSRLSLGQIRTAVMSNSRRLERLPHIEQGLSSSWAARFVYKGPSSFLPLARPRRQGPLQATYSGVRSRTGLIRHIPSQGQSPLSRIKLRTGFSMADACNSISQSGGDILLASSTPGGTTHGEADGEFPISPYNARETLCIWTESQNQTWIPAHYVSSNDPGAAGGAFRRKFYDVKCARFDPTNPNIFTSTGLDGVLTVWYLVSPAEKNSEVHDAAFADTNTQTNYEPVKRWGKETYGDYSCHDIVYRPQVSAGDKTLFSAPCDDGSIFIHSYTSEWDMFSQVPQFSVRSFRVAPHVSQKAGATAWGRAFTSNQLFVCSEADDDSLAFHGSFNFETETLLYHFDDHKNGEELALDPEGSTLALFTADEDILHLRLYDVKRKCKRRRAAVNLPKLVDDEFPEVRTAAWSPDGLLLAVGRNNDVAHIYDVRCLERGPVLSVAHDTSSEPLYGITVLSWTTETYFSPPSLGLVTGGGDHCIALWDIKTACKERQVLAELEGQVGVGHFGDLSKGEKPLVAGDTDGRIYIYDFVGRRDC